MRLARCLPMLLCGALGLVSCDKPTGPLVVPELVFEREAHWPRRDAYPGVGSGRIIVTNSYEDTVSIFDLEQLGRADFAELARVPVGLSPVELEGAHHAVVDPGGEYYYVGISNFRPGSGSGPHGAHGTGTMPGYAIKIRAADNRRVGSTRVDPNPGEIMISPDGATLFQTHFNVSQVASVAGRGGPESEMYAALAIIDAATMARKAMVPTCPAPHGMRFSPDGKKAYIACLSDEVAVVSLDDGSFPVARIKVAANAGTATSTIHEPYALTVSPTSGDVWVSSIRSNELQVLVGSTQQMDATRRLGLLGPPYFGTFSADGRTLYIPEQESDSIVVINPQTATVQRRIPLAGSGCLKAHQIVFTPDERYALVVCEGTHSSPGSLVVLDASANLAVSRVVPVGLFPDYVGIIRGMR